MRTFSPHLSLVCLEGKLGVGTDCSETFISTPCCCEGGRVSACSNNRGLRTRCLDSCRIAYTCRRSPSRVSIRYGLFCGQTSRFLFARPRAHICRGTNSLSVKNIRIITHCGTSQLDLSKGLYFRGMLGCAGFFIANKSIGGMPNFSVGLMTGCFLLGGGMRD